MYFLGVDSGGTKTAFLLIDGGGKPIFSHMAGSGHIAQIGKQGLSLMFTQFFEALEKKGISVEDISYSFLGMPGYSESAEWDKQIIEVLDAFLGKHYTCGNDCISGWAGSFACNPGINLVAGTGTICYSVNPVGESRRSGGWGHLIGDEGSGFWLGKNVLELFTKQSDGRLEKSPLYTIFRKELSLQSDADIIDTVYNRWNGSREKIAALAKIAHTSVLQGDTCALELIKGCAHELALMVFAAAGNFPEGAHVPVSYSGGVFQMGQTILEPFSQCLSSGGGSRVFLLSSPLLSPHKGAALYAAKLGGKIISPEFIDSLS